MRLVNIHTLELKNFTRPPPYFILSHRWSNDEISYKEFLKKRNTASNGYAKVVGMCKFVKHLPEAKYSYNTIKGSWEPLEREVEWVWVDTCCIDQRSSAELSEAINSMWKYYAEAQCCVAYLADVRSIDTARDLVLTDFMKSEWFERGWTLQELLAPRILVFCDYAWAIIGRRQNTDLVGLIGSITGIQREFLSGYGFWSASVAKKLSWASRRKTTREEDEAYCLLGLLGVNMPLLYGEGGERAFLRLQQEFIRRSHDESIFAWTGDDDTLGAILAPDARCFARSGQVQRITPGDPEHTVRPPYFVTHKGLQLTTPAEVIYAKDWREQASELNIVSLNCRDLSMPSLCTNPENGEQDASTKGERCRIALVPNTDDITCRRIFVDLLCPKDREYGVPTETVSSRTFLVTLTPSHSLEW